MKKIFIYLVLFLALCYLNIFIEANYNSVDYDSGFTLYENTKLDQELINYIEENNILIYKSDEAYPYYYRNDEFKQTTPVNATSMDVYEELLSEENIGTYYLNFEYSSVTMVEFEAFLSSYDSNIYFFEAIEESELSLNRIYLAIITIMIIIIFTFKQKLIKNQNLMKYLTYNGSFNNVYKKLILDELIYMLIAMFGFIITFFLLLENYSYYLVISSILISVVVSLIIIGIYVIQMELEERQIKKVIKTKNSSSKLLWSLNLLFIVLFMYVGVNAFYNFSTEVTKYVYLKNNEEIYSQFYYSFSERTNYYTNIDQEMSQSINEDKLDLNQLLYEQGAFQYEVDGENDYLKVDKNALEYFGLEEYTTYEYIVPLERKEEFLATGFVGNKENTYYYDQEVTLHFPLDYQAMIVKQPIIIVQQEETIMGTSFVLPATKSIDEYQAIVNEYYIDSTEQQGVVLLTYENILEEKKDIIIDGLYEVILYFILYLMIIYLINLFIIKKYYSDNKNEIRVKRVNGLNYLRPLYKKIMIIDICAIVVCFIINATILSYLSLVFINIFIYIVIRKNDIESRYNHD